jgi:predicted CXXCH cytochrome family protein
MPVIGCHDPHSTEVRFDKCVGCHAGVTDVAAGREVVDVVGYEYDGKTYAGPLVHQGGTQCTSCHDPVGSHHTFRIADAWATSCQGCHADAGGDPQKIRLVHTADYDGEGNATEPLSAEIDGLAARLLAAMQAVAALCYDPVTYPYFFKDLDGNKQCSAAEKVATNGFSAFTPALMKASFNYQFSRKEPGAWAHNFDYYSGSGCRRIAAGSTPLRLLSTEARRARRVHAANGRSLARRCVPLQSLHADRGRAACAARTAPRAPTA